MTRPRRRAALKITTYSESELTEEHYQPLNSATRGVRSSESISDVDNPQVPNNWQPNPDSKFPIIAHVQEASFVDDSRKAVRLADGTVLSKNDHINMVSEPPTDPYYIARIMGFFKKRNLKSNANLSSVENYEIKVNWYYRPRDILKNSSDSRLLYASMHTDLCPMSSFRGKVTVMHRDEIKDIVEYRCQPRHYWFEKLFDRYMIKYYDILPTFRLINLPANYQKALIKRFKYVFVEAGRGDDLLVTPKNCVKCNQWCSMADSVECAKCNSWYHMLCLSPPLAKKPSRGYSWSCAKCSKVTEDYLRALNGDEVEEPREVEEVEAPPHQIPHFEKLAIEFLERDKDLTLEQRRDKEEWQYRYLGMHARLEDALDVEDRPYPRASSRLGTKHQGNIDDWYGHKEVYYDKQSEVKGRKMKNKKKLVKDEPAFELPAEFKDTPLKDLPGWLKPRPEGFIERGLDDGSSSTLMWKQPDRGASFTNDIDFFVFKRCRSIAKDLKIFPNTPNFLDAIFKTLLDNNFDFEVSYQIIKKFTRQLLKEPTFSNLEVKRFEDGVRMYGSELLPVHRHVKSQPFGMIVRFYYLWKKTANGHLIWDNFEGRKNKKVKKNTKITDYVDSIADADDDSSYDFEAGRKQGRRYECKHCNTLELKKWFRAPGHRVAPQNTSELVMALCLRCAKLWRLYAVLWEDPYEVSKKISLRGTNFWKRKLEYELAQDALKIIEEKEKGKSKPNGTKRKSLSPDESTTPKKKLIKLEKEKPEKPEKIEKPGFLEEPPARPPRTKAKRLAKANNGLVEEVDKPKLREKKGLNKVKIESEVILGEIPNPGLTQAVEPPIKFPYNEMFTFDFENYDRVYKEFDNPLPEPKDEGSYPLSPKSRDQRAGFKMIGGSALFKPDKRACCVCRILDPSDVEDILICSNCGLNVHASCYGVTSHDTLKYSREWCCDSCLNDLHPILSTYYGCSLCYSKEIDHDSAITGSPLAYPDALKRTCNFKWAHVMCSLFSPDIRFQAADTMQGAINVPLSLVKNEINYCDICNIKSGVPTMCMLCKHSFHVTCAQDTAGYFIGFRICAEFDYKGPRTYDDKASRVVRIELSGLVGIPEPVLVCLDHPLEQRSQYPLVLLREKATWVDSGKGVAAEPLITLYVKGFMQWRLPIRGPALRFLESNLVKEELKRIKLKSKVLDPHSKPIRLQSADSAAGEDSFHDSYLEPTEPSNQVACSNSDGCNYCGVITTSKWWSASETTEECGFCKTKTRPDKHFLDFDDIKLSGKLYGLKSQAECKI